MTDTQLASASVSVAPFAPAAPPASALQEFRSLLAAGDRLSRISLAYIMLPLAIFAFGWLKLILAFALVWLLAVSWLLLGRRLPREVPATNETPPLTLRIHLFALLTAAVWVSFSGIGGHGFQNGDYVKHNGMLLDLIERPWPVAFSLNDLPAMLTYSFGYYLPAALAGKALGWQAANQIVYLWSIAGVYLSLLWFCRIAGSHPGAILFFVLASGMDIAGWLVFNGSFPRIGEHLEWWAGGMVGAQLSSNTTLLFWTPQHAIPGWLLGGLLADAILRRRAAGLALLVPALAALWSPFVMLGLAPFALLALAREGFRRALTLENLAAAPAIVLICGTFFASSTASIPMGIQWQALREHSDAAFFFWFVEFGAVALLIRPALRGGPGRPLWICALLAAILFTLVFMGQYNDLAMRGSIPALFVLAAFIVRAWHGVQLSRWRRGLLAVALAIGAVTPGFEFWRSARYFSFAPPDRRFVKSIAEMDPIFRQQYLGTPASFFFRRLARQRQDIKTETPGAD